MKLSLILVIALQPAPPTPTTFIFAKLYSFNLLLTLFFFVLLEIIFFAFFILFFLSINLTDFLKRRAVALVFFFNFTLLFFIFFSIFFDNESHAILMKNALLKKILIHLLAFNNIVYFFNNIA